MAFEHLRDTLTKGNLWLYVLAALEDQPATPVELKNRVKRDHGFSPATITFYSVLYKLQREGLVRRSTETYRSTYEMTQRGEEELQKGRELLSSVEKRLGSQRRLAEAL